MLAFQFCWTCDQNIPNQLLSIMNKVFANMYIVEFEIISSCLASAWPLPKGSYCKKLTKQLQRAGKNHQWERKTKIGYEERLYCITFVAWMRWLPVGSIPHLESVADGCYANWLSHQWACGSRAVQSLTLLPHCSSPAMSTRSGPCAAVSPPPSPGAWPCLTSQYYSGHNAAWIQSTGELACMLFLLVVNRLCSSPSFFLFVQSKICSLAFSAFHSFLPALFSFRAPPLPLFFSRLSSPWSEWGNRGVQWGNAVWIIQSWHFGAQLVFPGQPVLCVCIIWWCLTRWSIIHSFGRARWAVHDNSPTQRSSPPLIVPNIQLPATHIITHQIINPNLLSLDEVQSTFDHFWEELIQLKLIMQLIFRDGWTNCPISWMYFIGTNSRINLGFMRSVWWHRSVVFLWFLLNQFEKGNTIYMNVHWCKYIFSRYFYLVLK